VGEHRDLIAYQLALRLVVELQAAVARWPRFERWSTGMQLVRAAGSIGANIAEAEGRWHGRDRAKFLLNARGSLFETKHWLDVATAAGHSPQPTIGKRPNESGDY
jgi:four helix bundle protein